MFYSGELRRTEAWVAWKKAKTWEFFLISRYLSLNLQSWEGLFPCLTHTQSPRGHCEKLIRYRSLEPIEYSEARVIG